MTRTTIVIALCILGAGLLLFGDGFKIPGRDTSIDGPIHLIVVEEAKERTTYVAAMTLNDKWKQTLSDRNVKFRTYDDDQKAAIDNGYTAKANEVGMPAMILLDGDGDLLHAGKCPESVDAIDAELRRFGR